VLVLLFLFVCYLLLLSFFSRGLGFYLFRVLQHLLFHVFLDILTFVFSDFLLEDWYLSNKLPVGSNLDQTFIQILSDQLKISPYLGQQCLSTDPAYSMAVNNWNNGNNTQTFI